MSSTSVTRSVKFRREVSYTSLYVFTLAAAPITETLDTLSIATAVEYALDRMRNVFSVVDWFELSKDKYRAILGIPEWLPTNARFATSLTLSSQVDSSLSDFVSAIAPDFTALKKRAPYRPFAIALLFRAVIADELGKLPYKVADDAELSEDAPAAFDPSELLSGSVCRVPSETARKKHMTFARIDPSIFDQSDLFPNGAVDAEGYDDSEMF